MATVEASVNVSEAFCFFASTKHSLQFTRQPPQSQLNPQQLISHEGIRHLAALWVARCANSRCSEQHRQR